MALKKGRNAVRISVLDMDQLDENGNPLEKVTLIHDHLDGQQLVDLEKALMNMFCALGQAAVDAHTEAEKVSIQLSTLAPTN